MKKYLFYLLLLTSISTYSQTVKESPSFYLSDIYNHSLILYNEDFIEIVDFSVVKKSVVKANLTIYDRSTLSEKLNTEVKFNSLLNKGEKLINLVIFNNKIVGVIQFKNLNKKYDVYLKEFDIQRLIFKNDMIKKIGEIGKVQSVDPLSFSYETSKNERFSLFHTYSKNNKSVNHQVMIYDNQLEEWSSKKFSTSLKISQFLQSKCNLSNKGDFLLTFIDNDPRSNYTNLIVVYGRQNEEIIIDSKKINNEKILIKNIVPYQNHNFLIQGYEYSTSDINKINIFTQKINEDGIGEQNILIKDCFKNNFYNVNNSSSVLYSKLRHIKVNKVFNVSGNSFIMHDINNYKSFEPYYEKNEGGKSNAFVMKFDDNNDIEWSKNDVFSTNSVDSYFNEGKLYILYQLRIAKNKKYNTALKLTSVDETGKIEKLFSYRFKQIINNYYINVNILEDNNEILLRFKTKLFLISQ